MEERLVPPQEGAGFQGCVAEPGNESRPQAGGEVPPSQKWSQLAPESQVYPFLKVSFPLLRLVSNSLAKWVIKKKTERKKCLSLDQRMVPCRARPGDRVSPALKAPNSFFFFLTDGHSDRCKVISHCSFNLYFSNNYWCWTSFHVFVRHLYVLFGEMQIKTTMRYHLTPVRMAIGQKKKWVWGF